MNQSYPLPATGSQPRENAASALMLSDLQKAHDELVAAMAVMDIVTRADVAERSQYSSARWRLSQASLRRRTLWAAIFQHLRPRVGCRDAADLDWLQTTHLEMLHNSAAHVGKWTVDRIEADWRGYCEASRAIRWKMKAAMGAEKRILYPLLTGDALGRP